MAVWVPCATNSAKLSPHLFNGNAGVWASYVRYGNLLRSDMHQNVLNGGKFCRSRSLTSCAICGPGAPEAAVHAHVNIHIIFQAYLAHVVLVERLHPRHPEAARMASFRKSFGELTSIISRNAGTSSNNCWWQ